MKTELKFLFLSLLSMFMISCNNYSNLYELTDEFVESLDSSVESYGLLGGMDEKKLTEDGQFQVMPTGRLINVKIMREASDEEYESLMDDLKSHYKGHPCVNDVYRCKAGTLMIDCRN